MPQENEKSKPYQGRRRSREKEKEEQEQEKKQEAKEKKKELATQMKDVRKEAENPEGKKGVKVEHTKKRRQGKKDKK